MPSADQEIFTRANASAFTGSAEDKAHEKALAAGFQIYMEKLSHPDLLMTEVAKLLRRSCS